MIEYKGNQIIDHGSADTQGDFRKKRMTLGNMVKKQIERASKNTDYANEQYLASVRGTLKRRFTGTDKNNVPKISKAHKTKFDRL